MVGLSKQTIPKNYSQGFFLFHYPIFIFSLCDFVRNTIFYHSTITEREEEEEEEEEDLEEEKKKAWSRRKHDRNADKLLKISWNNKKEEKLEKKMGKGKNKYIDIEKINQKKKKRTKKQLKEFAKEQSITK